ncbi:Mediator of RNA polymerase II transcription subunit 18 [Talaromyces atroroseus]|uniref:Mediator of RNA polymerase II transcription subunit 18 n=1 Tax=Talaromyces atroroseus TaxID=1441469 RepID=A0A225ANL7_TALAT|nr:Mediator of RNA polymerase II transcription subunit 18 [Talaromyces atroroseus]OKL58888.1 Mediator of RNA polymerase II transcription subunit 18 [Talaromyces atroroseus]
MHEFLLFAPVPAHQHHELLQQLAGLTAMQPRHRLERRLIFKANRKAGRINTRLGGGSQDVQATEIQRLLKMMNGATYYNRVVSVVAEDDFGAPAEEYDFDSQLWRMEWRDIPEAGTRSGVTSRLMANAVLPQGDIVSVMKAWGYTFVNEFVIEGDVFVYNDTVLFLHRVLNYPEDNQTTQQTQRPRTALPPLKDLTLLDPSGSYLLQASATVQDGANAETATQRLYGLRDQLRTAVRLEQADRLSLDTRVK